MAKSRAAGKKTANKKAASKAAAKKPTKGASKTAAKRPTSAAKKVVKKTAVEASPKKAPAKKAPAAKKKVTAPAKKSAPAKAKAAAKSTTGKAKAAPAKKAAPPAKPVKPARAAAPKVAAPKIVEAEELSRPVPPPRTEPVEPRPPAAPGTISAHPDSQLTEDQVALLHEKLLAERQRVVAGFDRHLAEALGEAVVMPDETDMAQRSTEQAYLIRFADKERKLLSEIEHAIEKMRTGEYGVCEGTEEAIGFKRLELRPWTRYSVGYKEQMERERSQHRR